MYCLLLVRLVCPTRLSLTGRMQTWLRSWIAVRIPMKIWSSLIYPSSSDCLTFCWESNIDNACDCLVLKSWKAVPALYLQLQLVFVLGGASSILCLWLCECSAILGTLSHQCAYVVSCTHTKVTFEIGEKYYIVPASFCSSGICKHQKCPAAKWCNCFFCILLMLFFTAYS